MSKMSASPGSISQVGNVCLVASLSVPSGSVSMPASVLFASYEPCLPGLCCPFCLVGILVTSFVKCYDSINN